MQPPSLGIDSVPKGKKRVAVDDAVVLAGANFVLRHFAKAGRGRGAPLLVVAPLSGHFGWLMRDCVAAMLPDHDVFLMEWLDAAEIPADAGRMGFDQAIGAVMQAIRHLGPGLAVLGVSQAPTLILAAASLLTAEMDPAAPRALVLLGGFLDPRQNPTNVGQLAARLPKGWFTRTLAEPVPAGHAGQGRLVYPAKVHAQALARYLHRHLATGGELSAKMQADDGLEAEHFPFRVLYQTLMDLPAEFAEENSRKVFAEAHLARNLLSYRGRLVEPALLQDCAVMSVEGGKDDSSGARQTHVVHALCPKLRRRVLLDMPQCGHFGLFHGKDWREEIMPAVAEFLTAR